MTGSGPLASITVFFRAAEGPGLLLLVVIFIAAGSFQKRKISAKTQTYTHTSHFPDRTA